MSWFAFTAIVVGAVLYHVVRAKMGLPMDMPTGTTFDPHNRPPDGKIGGEGFFDAPSANNDSDHDSSGGWGGDSDSGSGGDSGGDSGGSD